MTYRLVEPEYQVVDLSRHVATPEGVRRYHKPIGSPLGKGGSLRAVTTHTPGTHAVRFEAKKMSLDVEHASRVGRAAYHMEREDQLALYEAHGFKSQYAEVSDKDLYSKWELATGTEKARLLTEIHNRAHAMVATLAMVQEAEKTAKREHMRGKMIDRWDAHMAKSAPGRALLKIRDRLVSDKALDRFEKIAEAVRDYGKEWRFRIVENRLVGYLVSSLVSLAGAGAGALAGGAAKGGHELVSEHGGGAAEAPSVTEHVAEAVHQFLENPLTEAGLGAMVGMGLLVGAKILKDRAVKKKVTKTLAETTAIKKGVHQA